MRVEDLDPGVASPFAGEVPGHVPSGQARDMAGCEHDVGVVLAYPAPAGIFNIDNKVRAVSRIRMPFIAEIERGYFRRLGFEDVAQTVYAFIRGVEVPMHLKDAVCLA